MTKATGTYTSYVSNLAQEKGVYGPWSTFFASVMTKTSDTGQFAPATTSTYVAGYEIFAFNDALSGSFPLYLRVNYSIGNISPGMSIQLGTGSNGAGTITGSLLGPFSVTNGYTGSSPVRSWYGSSDGTYLSFVCNLQASGTSSATQPDSLGAFVIERTRDADGTPNGNGVTVWVWNATADNYTAVTANNSFQGFYSRYYDSTATQPLVQADYGVVPPNLGNNTSYAGVNANYIFPAFTQIGAQLYGASKGLALAYPGDVPKQQAFSATHYGAASQWIAIGNSASALVPYLSAATTAGSKILCPVFRWE